MKKFRKKSTEKVAPIPDLVKEQAARIAELKAENAALIQKLDAYVAREKELTETIAFAKKKCDEMVSETKVRYALECERLKNFRDKWTAAARDGYLQYGVEQTEKILQECRKEMERAFADDLGISDYLSERDRLGADPTLNYRAILSEEKKDPPPAKRKIEELSERDLAELLKQI